MDSITYSAVWVNRWHVIVKIPMALKHLVPLPDKSNDMQILRSSYRRWDCSQGPNALVELEIRYKYGIKQRPLTEVSTGYGNDLLLSRLWYDIARKIRGPLT
jgi:hypothetical protein